MFSLKNLKWNIQEKQHEDIYEDLLLKRSLDLKYLEPLYTDLYDPFLMHHMKEAVERIQKAVEKKEKILIYGDYDVDGITSTAFLYKSLKKIGADVTYFLPDRVKDGYGLSSEYAPIFQKEGIHLMITVDTGITNVEEVKVFQQHGMEVIVTDHHTPLEIIPDCIILNPKKKECHYPYKGLVGAGVAYKLVQALSTMYPEITETYLKWSLSYIALATVVDCAKLVDENRVIVSLGLLALQKSKEPWIQAMMEIIQKPQEEISPRTLGFQIGPRLNAAGRIASPNTVLEFFLSEDSTEAFKKAKYLNNLNIQRQEILIESLEKAEEVKDETQEVIFAFDPHWNMGVIGLIAGKLSEKYHKPVFAMTENERKITGSIRNPIPEINVTDALVAAEKYLDHFGGHSQAAGFSLLPENKEKFVEVIKEYMQKNISKELLQPSIIVDRCIDIKDIDISLVEKIQTLSPFGLGNPQPLFCIKNCILSNMKNIGSQSNHFACEVIGEDGTALRAISFYSPNWLETIQDWKNVDILGRLHINEWNNIKSVQMVLEDIREIPRGT